MVLLDNVMSEMHDGRRSRSSPPTQRQRTAPSTNFKIPRRTNGESSGVGSSNSNINANKRPQQDKAYNDNYGAPVSKRQLVVYSDENNQPVFNASQFITTKMNYFRIDISSMPDLERIHMEVNAVAPNGKVYLLNGDDNGRGGLAKQTLKWGLQTVWKLVVKRSPELFSNNTDYRCGAYDVGAAVYFPVGLYTGGDEVTVELLKSENDPKAWSAIAKMCKKEIQKIAVKFVRNNGTSNGLINANGEESLAEENRQELVRAVEVITSQSIMTRDYFQYGNTTFPRESDRIVIHGQEKIDSKCQFDAEGKELKTGFEKSVKIIAGDRIPEMVCSIDVRRCPFYQESLLINFVSSLFNQNGERGGGNNRAGFERRGSLKGGRGNRNSGPGRDQSRSREGYGRDDRYNDHGGNDDRSESGVVDPSAVNNMIQKMKRMSENQLNEILDETRGFAVNPTHLQNGRLNMFYIHSFTCKTANEFTFTLKDGSGEERIVSVTDYFLNKYKIKLKYPDAPLVVQKRGSSLTYWPMEVLKIERGQRVKISRITPTIQTAMTTDMAMLPEAHIERYNKILFEQLKVLDNVYLGKFNIRVSTTPMEVNGNILSAAVIHFAGRRTFHPSTGVSMKPQITQQGTVLRPATDINIMLLNFGSCLGDYELKDFQRCVENWCRPQECRIRGWKIKECQENDHRDVEKLMFRAKEDGITIVIGITRDKKSEAHDVLKYYESIHGIQTYHLSQMTVQKMQKQHVTAENVMRKFNLKCGGLNFLISVPRQAEGRFICTQDKEINQTFFENTMTIGFELSHASATCLFDEQNNITCGEPSVVGVSYSLGISTDLGGFSYLQKTRDTSLMNLEKHFPQIIHNYLKVKKALPSKIVIYRSGTGEGDFPKIEKEVNTMRRSIATDPKLSHFAGGSYRPNFLMIVVHKNSHIRVFPKDIRVGKAHEQNVPSGTCIDHLVTGYRRNEFILVSQSALIGTIRPAKYTILVNDPEWSKNEVYGFTYFLAFGHQVSCQPPAVPDVLYAAENNAKRGRNNWKTHQKIQRIEGELSRNDPSAQPDDDNDSKMEQLSDWLNRCTLQTKNFWA